MLGMHLGFGMPRKNNNIPLSLSPVFDIDATLAASYPGSGQTLANLVQAPSDGSLRSAYDFVLGANSTVSTDDPTFTGTPGNPAAYLACDGGDYVSLQPGTIPAWLNNIYNIAAADKYTIINCFQYGGAGAGFLYLSGNTTSSTAIGMRLQFTNTGVMQLVGANGSSSAVASLHSGLVAGTNYLHVLTYDAATKSYKSALNSLSFTVSGTLSGSDGSSPSTTRYGFGSSGGGNPVISGTRLYAHAGLRSIIADSDLARLVKMYNTRHGRVYA